jgi:FKBP-type peptidyl-prolyl cis-trans isomerase
MIASGDESYAFGMNVGAGLVADGIVPNMNEFIQGMKDVLAGAELRFSEFEADMIMRAAYQTMMEERQFSALEQENIFLEENSRKPGISVTPSGLQYEIIVETFGQKPTIEDLVRLNYEGRYIDGEIFDSSYERGEPEVLHLGGLIPGMTEALQMMSEGSKYRFFIPSELAYGAGGGPIRPFATLIFEVELLEIIDEADFYSLFN